MSFLRQGSEKGPLTHPFTPDATPDAWVKLPAGSFTGTMTTTPKNWMIMDRYDDTDPMNHRPAKKRRRGKFVDCGCKRRRDWLVKQGKALASRVSMLEEAVSGLIQKQQEHDTHEQEQEQRPVHTTLGKTVYHEPKRFVRKPKE